MHPFGMEEVRIAELLGSLRFEEAGLLSRAGQQPVFEREEIERLAPALTQALSIANPDQRVDFVSHGRTGTSFGNARKTEGTLFVDRDARLNIAFSGIRQIMTVDDDFTQFQDTSLGDPLNLDRAMIRLLAGGAVERKTKPDGAPFPLWIIVALNGDQHQEAKPQGRIEAKPDPEPMPTRLDPTNLTVDSAGDATIERETLIESHADETKGQAIRDRLEFLKSLHDDGLISDDEYRRERERALRLLD
ncbi:MAG: hypothetical protein EA370_09310 [Wenzhouxiangella sp.]|nr:MAG: hypothetical protein EA370_09310 [Wenzhouxiangella sp.]